MKEAARGRLDTKSDYESIRNARILENQARLASLGLHKTVLELRLLTSSAKSVKRKCNKVDYRSSTPRRCSARLNGMAADSTPKTATPSDQRVPSRRIRQLRRTASGSGRKKRFASAPLVRLGRGEGMKAELSPEILAQHCASKSRGSVYDRVFGICCHFCRQKNICGEEDCRRCGNRDIDEPCIGKTECSACHSSNGVICRACLKVRYGEEMENVRRNEQWMCPHCTEDKGINPFWICNSSFCLRKRKISPTGAHPNQGPVRNGAWVPPTSGWVKINFDAGLNSSKSAGSLGVVVRDWLGGFVAAKAVRGLPQVSVRVLQCMAAREAMVLALTLNFRRVVLEGDTQQIIAMLAGDIKMHQEVVIIVSDVQQMSKSFEAVRFSFARRSGNVAAHCVANHYCTVGEGCVTWMHAPPSWLESALCL